MHVNARIIVLQNTDGLICAHTSRADMYSHTVAILHVNSKPIKCYSETKHWASAYSLALHGVRKISGWGFGFEGASIEVFGIYCYTFLGFGVCYLEPILLNTSMRLRGCTERCKCKI